jgi:hypothetical protein
MVMAGSSQTVAGDGVQHRACQERQTDGDKENVEHAASQLRGDALN